MPSSVTDDRIDQLRREMGDLRSELKEVRSEVREVRDEVHKIGTANAVVGERVDHLADKIEEVISRIERMFPGNPPPPGGAVPVPVPAPSLAPPSPRVDGITITPQTIRNVIWLIVQIATVLGALGYGISSGYSHERPETSRESHSPVAVVPSSPFVPSEDQPEAP